MQNLANEKLCMQRLANEKLCMQILANEKRCMQILANEKLCMQILANEKLRMQILANEKLCMQMLANEKLCMQNSANEKLCTGEFWQEAGDLSQLRAGLFAWTRFFCNFERTIRRVQECPDPHLYSLMIKSPTSQEVLIYSYTGILLSYSCGTG